ncbi:MAG: hypothetical protein HY654_13080 [Acidobacteria bacterium]|nr:hypothetical protein [Acidobacteriota bacterium]
MRAFTLGVILLTFASGIPQPAAEQAADPDIVQRFLNRPDPSLTQYRAARRLEARNERFKVAGWVDACTELSPESGFRYRIVSEGGNGLIRGRVLKKALETEREARAKGEVDQSRITPENYDFVAATAGSDEELTKVILTPRRKSRMLIDGALFLSPDGDLVRMEGRPASNPSFWTRRVTILRLYDRLAGVRVPLSLESTADIRIAGRSTFRMTYQYFTINGQEIPGSDAPCPVAGP